MEDPAKQEQIRRGPHRYEPSAGRHGSYVPTTYKHQEYPKMLGKWPKPELKQFTKTEAGVIVSAQIADANYQAALKTWNDAMEASVVNSKAEEVQWLKANG
jgi:hypothetical protein